MLPDDRLAGIARDCGIAVRLAEDGESLRLANSHDLVSATAVLTRALLHAARLRVSGQNGDDVCAWMEARRSIGAELRRRAAERPPASRA